MRVFPDHCVNSASITVTSRRRLMPEVAITSNHDLSAASSSILIVVVICANSARTNWESWSPSAWYLASTAYASSDRSFVINQRGDSGRNLGERSVRLLISHDNRLTRRRWSGAGSEQAARLKGFSTPSRSWCCWSRSIWQLLESGQQSKRRWIKTSRLDVLLDMPIRRSGKIPKRYILVCRSLGSFWPQCTFRLAFG